MAGSVKGIIPLPLQDQTVVTRTFYAAIDDATTNSWRISTTGAAASWSTITTATLRKAVQPTHSDGSGGIFSTAIRGATPWASVDHKIYFPGDDYNSNEDVGVDTPPTVYSFDGTSAIKRFTVPKNPYQLVECHAIISIVPYSATEILFSVYDYDSVTSRTRVLLYDTITGNLQQLGPASDIRGGAMALLVFQNRVWIAPVNFQLGVTLDISWIRPGDAAWTTDAAFQAAAIGGVGLVEFLGDLYLGTHSSAATGALIRKRTTATSIWSTVLTLNGSGTGQYVGPLIKTADGLTALAYFNNVDGTAPVQRIVKSTDGTTWATDLDIVADLGAGYIVSGFPYLDSDDSIYWPLRKSDNTGFIKKRTSAGVWSTVDTIANLRGPMMALKVVS
jgi:hypothetical protein